MSMKKFIPFLGLAFLFAACSSEPETQTQTLQSANQASAKDTAGLAQFQQWKAQNELSSAENVQLEQEPAVAVQAPVQTKTIVREVIVERPAPARRPAARRETPVSTPPAPTPSETSTFPSEGSGSTVGSGTETAGTSQAPAPEVAKKEGWSKAAKGAAIGGAGGAVLGAIIGKKNPAVGAAVGGVLGGAVGYGIGRGKDKKDGRY
jgi:hypothetical protein